MTLLCGNFDVLCHKADWSLNIFYLFIFIIFLNFKNYNFSQGYVPKHKWLNLTNQRRPSSMRIQFLSTELFSVDLEARVRRVTGD